MNKDEIERLKSQHIVKKIDISAQQITTGVCDRVLQEVGAWHRGMDHHESIKSAIAREMKEEVNLKGDFSYEIIAVDDPAYLNPHDF